MFNDGFATVPLAKWTNMEPKEGGDTRVRITTKKKTVQLERAPIWTGNPSCKGINRVAKLVERERRVESKSS